MSCDALGARLELKLMNAVAVGATAAAAADGILLQGSILALGHRPPHWLVTRHMPSNSQALRNTYCGGVLMIS